MLKLRGGNFRQKQGDLLDSIDQRIGARMKQLREAEDPKKEALGAS